MSHGGVEHEIVRHPRVRFWTLLLRDNGRHGREHVRVVVVVMRSDGGSLDWSLDFDRSSSSSSRFGSIA